MANSKIKIKPSKQGSLRKAMGAKKGSNLSVAAMNKKLHSKGTTPAMKKKLVFALNARKWKKEDGGLIMMEDGGTLTQSQLGGLSMAGGMAGDIINQVDGADGRTSIGGQALGGAAKGAAAGLAFGGVGAIVGGAIGGIGGLVKGAINKKQYAREDAVALQNKMNGIQANQVSINADAGNPYAPAFAYGGFVTDGPGDPPAKTTTKPTVTQDNLNYKDGKLNLVNKTEASYFFDPKEVAALTRRRGSYQDWKGNTNGSLAGTPLLNGKYFEFRMKDGSFRSVPVNEINQYWQGDVSNLKEMAEGGIIPNGMPNAEVEKQEVAQGPDGSMEKFNLPSHANATAASQFAFEPGTRIYSDKLKVDNKKTFADEADAIRRQIEKYEQILYS